MSSNESAQLARPGPTSPQLRICPVEGCPSYPLKHLPEHLAYAHPELTQDARVEYVKKALVFHLPRGQRKAQAVVRRRGRLQLARKSTGGGRQQHKRKRRHRSRGDVERGGGGGEVTSSLSSSEEESEEEYKVVSEDKSVQCNLLSSALLDRMASVVHSHSSLSATSVTPPRPQYARKSTCSATNSRSSSRLRGGGANVHSESMGCGDGLVVRKKKSFTLRKKRIDCSSSFSSFERNGGGREKEHQVLPPSTTSSDGLDPSNSKTSPTASATGELTCKWGQWDVIFFETPQIQCPPKTRPHSVILNL